MCAIAGIIDLSYDQTIIDSMLATMQRRGPDANGCKALNGCCLLHSRLAVIDLEGGVQPMDFETEGESYTIVYNGEIYNTAEVRNELISYGHRFLGHSDTEVVLHAFVQWGDDCLNKLNGIFAFAVWEHKRRRLFLARDRMGVKPLFYAFCNGGLLFSSEIKTILEYPHMEAVLDSFGVAQLLLLGPGRIPGSGVFRDIFELEPGQCAFYDDGKLRIEQYWRLTDSEHRESFEDTAAYVRWLVMDSIKRQNVSDVPVGTFLSGGLDSSLISKITSDTMREKGCMLPTFSLDYRNNDIYFTPGKFQPNSDTSFIHIMENALATDSHWTILTAEDLLGSLEAATVARDLPGMADVDFSLLAFCGNIRKRVKVALSGECADEIFGGYPWYRDQSVLEQNGFPWAQNTAYRSGFLAQHFADRINAHDFVHTCYQQTIDSCDILPGTSDKERRMKQMVNLNQRWFMQTLLDRKDRMSMYHGLEIRVPFCDHRIAEYLYSVPWSFKDYNNTEKGLLRHAMSDILPNEILWRKKSPYPKTHDPAYCELVADKLGEVLRQPGAPLLQIVNRDALRNLLTLENTCPWYGQLMQRPQTIAFMIQINFWLEHYNIRIVD